MKFSPVPFVGGFYADETRPWSVQDCVNWLPTQAETSGTRTPTILKTPPGLKPAATFSGGGPVRGTYNAQGVFLTVSGNKLYRVNNDLTTTLIGTIPGTGLVKFAHNQQSVGNQVVIVNGSAGWVYDTNAKTLTKITDEGYPGAINAVFLDSYIVQIEPARRFAFNSAAANATQYNTLDRFTSEVSPDLLMSLAVTNDELILFSQTTTEFFQVTDEAEQPFRTKRISLTRGCGGRYTVANLDNTVYWLGDDGIFYVLAGYSPQRISTRPIEEAIRGLNWDQAFAFTWESAGHKVCYWTFPDGTTWGWDVSAQQWSRRQSYDLNRWRPSSMTFWNGKWYAGDFQTPTLWEVDWDYMLEGDQEFVSERTTGVITDNQNLLIVSRLELLMQVGQEITTAVAAPSTRWESALGLQWTNTGNNVTLPFSGTVSGSLLPSVVLSQAQIAMLLSPGETIVGIRAAGTLTVSAFTTGSQTSFHWGPNVQSQPTAVGANPFTLAETTWNGVGNVSLGASLIAGGTSITFAMSQLDIEILSPAPPVEVSNEPDNFVRVQYSDDGGNNWSNWDQVSIGEVGQYNERPVFTRQGRSRQRVYRIRCSSPRKRDLLGAVIVVQGTVG